MVHEQTSDSYATLRINPYLSTCIEHLDMWIMNSYGYRKSFKLRHSR